MKNPRLRLGLVLWLIGMVGVVMLSMTVVPQFLERKGASVPAWVAVAASMAQSAVLLALAVWAGVALSRPLGLRAPAAEAASTGNSAWSALKPQLLPGAFVALVAGGALLLLARIAPVDSMAGSKAIGIPLAAKVLYGGITEELLLRWGVMTVLAWLAWRFIQKRQGTPRPALMIAAAFVAAVLFGASHLPAAIAAGDTLTGSVLLYVLAGNTALGTLFGIMYWRYGLEAAMLAHGLAHVVAVLGSAIVS